MLFDKKEILAPLYEFSKSVKVTPVSAHAPGCPWCGGLKYEHKDQLMEMHQEILDFALWVSPTKEETYIRLLIIYRIQNIVSTIWPNAKVLYHGSFAENTATPVGDIDLSIEECPTGKTTIELLNTLYEFLKDNKIFFRIKFLPQAAVPLIKGTTDRSRYKVDITIQNSDGLINVKRFRKIVVAYPAVFPLLLFIKTLLIKDKMNLPFYGGINNYCLYIMIICIIQSTPDENDRLNCGFLLLRFFKIFGYEFNYYTTGITMSNDGRLFNRKEAGLFDTEYNMNLCIQCQLILSKTFGSTSDKIQEFREICQNAYQKLSLPKEKDENSLLLRITTSIERLVDKRIMINELYDEITK